MFDKNSIDDSIEFLSHIDIYEESSLEELFDFDTSKKPEELENEEQIAVSAIKINELKTTGESEKAYEAEVTETHEKPGDAKEPEDHAEYAGSEEPKQSNLLGNIIYLTGCVIVALLLSIVISKFVMHNTVVEGDSMNNTLSDNDRLLIDKLSYVIGEPSRFDIIVFANSDTDNYIKRIIGLPGETVQIYKGDVYINGFKLNNDVYGKEPIIDAGLAAEPVTLGEDEYFVLGDNRNNSIDSRKKAVGKVKKSVIDGRAVFRLYPFSGFGIIKK